MRGYIPGTDTSRILSKEPVKRSVEILTSFLEVYISVKPITYSLPLEVNAWKPTPSF